MINERIQKMYSRMHFIASSALIVGIGIIILSLAFYFIVLKGDSKFTDILIWVIFAGLSLSSIGYWIIRNVKKLATLDAQEFKFDSNLISLFFGVAILWIIVGVPFLYFFPIWGVVITFVFFGIFFDIVRLIILIQKAKNRESMDKIGFKEFILMAWRLIYPQVRHDHISHRLITIVGWVVSFFSWFILFPIYFGVIQRMIYFVMYGDEKKKWMVVKE
ncbi:MAG: hypothetical protein PHH40_02460 [Candidatus Moranbacteria bacterium]|nr:hypothetical protein [Candidatus Moranbacteria bacterium]MDD3965237.1 hypothetical protein [Candidatus Moranbacteria bacterium]